MMAAVIIMGVCGVGKTTIGRMIAERLQWRFIEGDDYHPQSNVDKMARGVALDDADRFPWFDRLHAVLRQSQRAGENVVLACSALKVAYRKRLSVGLRDVLFLFLTAERDLIASRMRARPIHFMKPEMLESQFQILEIPTDAITLDVAGCVDDVVVRTIDAIRSGLKIG